jgi:hypothetical protein
LTKAACIGMHLVRRAEAFDGGDAIAFVHDGEG